MTDADVDIFHRPELAADLTRRLLNRQGPGLWNGESSLRSGMFLTGLRGIGKTTFLFYDLMPALGDAGAVVIFVSLAQCAGDPPPEVLLGGIRKALKKLKSGPESYLSAGVRLIKPVNWKLGSLSLSFDVDRVGEEDGVYLADAFFEVVEKAQTDVVLIVDEVQELSRTPAGEKLLWDLKATRDAVNNRPGEKESFVFIGAGSHPAMIHEMVANSDRAFCHAENVPYPVLGNDYVEFALKVFEENGVTKLPSLNAAVRAFEVLGDAPDELYGAIANLQKTSSSATLDESLLEIANNRAVEKALSQVERVIQMGPLASAIFTKISSDGGELRNPVSRSAVVEYSKLLGREVQVAEALLTRQELVAANLIVRKAATCYRISNPLVRKLWREEQEAEE